MSFNKEKYIEAEKHANEFLASGSERFETVITDEETQEYMQDVVKDCCRSTHLPHIQLVFDDQGGVTTRMSAKDEAIFTCLFDERWATVQENIQQAEHEHDALPEPEAPSFLTEPEPEAASLDEYLAQLDAPKASKMFTEVTGDTSALNAEELTEYNQYQKQQNECLTAMTSHISTLDKLRTYWDFQNKEHSFPSITDKNQREHYDTAREMAKNPFAEGQRLTALTH